MPKLRFSWDAFDDTTVNALAVASGYDRGGDTAREFLNEKVKRPTAEFVKNHKDLLVRTWLSEYSGSKDVVDRLLDAQLGPMGKPQGLSECAQYIDKCRNSKSLRSFILEAMLRFGDRDHQGTMAEDFVPRFAVLTPAEQTADARKPYDFQQEAWNVLSSTLAASQATGVFQGLMVMPTGSGKTYTAVRWLLENVVARGQQVLWLVHRQELVAQATAEFQRLALLAKPQERIRIRAVSGVHCSSTQIDRADHVVVASVLSLQRREIVKLLLDEGRRFVVVDEAHHAPASSYRQVIDQLQKHEKWQLLGLTATPTRTVEEERPLLSQIFGSNLLYQITLKELVQKGILAVPVPVRVQTGTEIEDQISQSDIEHLERFRELGEELKRKIAGIAGRNRFIVQHYLENREKYGQTLIFALDVLHAHELTMALREHGVRADYATSYRHDDADSGPTTVIEKFRAGDLEVLVNVQIVTEGVDVPGIQTVFLTRPTTSEVLMRQMVGRALRGKRAGGTEYAYLVSFEDHWARFRNWMSAFDLISDVLAVAEPAPEESLPEEEAAVAGILQELPWDIIHEAAASLRELPLHRKADVFEAVPAGYFTFEREDEGEPVVGTVCVYEHQKPCWEALFEHLARRSSQELEGLSAEQKKALYFEYFEDCDEPLAFEDDVQSVIQHFAHGGERPEHHDFEARRLCAPEELAQLIWNADMGERARSELLEERFSPLAKAVYGDLREFRAAVEDALDELKNPQDADRRVRAVPIFHPRPDQQLSPGPHHKLPELMAQVLKEGAALIGVPELQHTGSLEWTKRLVKGWYGMAYSKNEEPFGHGRIRMNVLLDSKDMSEATIKFLLWHEYLHLHLKQGHTSEFRRLERLWPGHVPCDAELDTLNERFGVQYW